ncbi:type VI secretion system tip protein VgrG [Enterobacter sp. Ap-1006]|uniref:type VI secretion system Vgr family protein n=1 Tax=Enterobacter sp. Ap-1006 TaxID=2608345 RepID=UPI0014249035|nr:type VI secretion system tip protein TssI/VgrG [Enterobacter sp. Ap-1006]NIF48400.1 type VI secretion system tip protein VgrG [Enterobacter sp. Ap-1006]
MLNSNQLKTDQENHFIRWNGDIANDLLLVSLAGKESLFVPYEYELHSVTHKKEAELLRWHGQEVSCQIGGGGNELPQRVLHGVVTRIRYAQRTSEEGECILTLEPAFSQLKHGRGMRVWQNISVPDLVHDLLNEHKISQLDLQLNGTYDKREYCVQYRESAFDFIQRLLQDEGIYYYFKHSESGHTLVLTDHAAGHKPTPGKALLWHHHGDVISEATITKLESSATLLPGGVALHGVNMQQSAAIEDLQKTSGKAANNESVMFIDITPQGERALITQEAKNTLAAYEANNQFFSATVQAHWLNAGETFDLKGHPAGDQAYLIHEISIVVSNDFDGSSSSRQCQIEATHADKPWHPPFLHQQPQIPGILTATVVGPDSEEIHTDEYGRIKIQFPWDKENKNDDASSCWVRVAQTWAGGKFGAQFIPRVSSEVLVSFIQGNPDYPLVTGMVYNGQNKPPFDLPAQKTQSGFVTRSATKGSVEDGHRLSFDDKKGEELMTIVAQKDLELTVKNDVTSTIAANRNTELTKGNDLLLLKEGNLNLTLEKGNWQQEISGDITTKIKNGNYILDVAGGSGSVKTEKALSIESTQSIELKVGNNKIAISTSGITINGAAFKVESSAGAELKGATVKVEGSGTAELKGAMVKVEGSGTAELKGAMATVSGSGMTTISGGIINIG